MSIGLQFVLKARDEASAVIKKLAGEVDGLSSTAARLGGAVGPVGILAASAVSAATAIAVVGRKYADAVETIERRSAAIGTGTKELQVLEKTFERFGLQPERAGQSLAFLNRAIDRGDPLLKQMGITTRNASEAYSQLMDRFAGSSDAAKRQAIAFKLLGRSGGELVGVAGEFNATLKDTEVRMTAANALFSGKSVDAAHDIDKALEELDIKWQGMTKTMADEFLPTAARVIKAAGSILDFMRDLSQNSAVKLSVELTGNALVGLGRMVDDLKLLKVILANPTRSLQENYAEAGITPPTAKNAPSFGSEGNPGNVNAPKRDDKKGGGDSLRGVNSQFKIVGYDENGDPIFGDPKDKESPREKAIKAISAAMRTSITVATELQNRLDRIKDAKTATDLSAALGGERGLSLGARVAIEANSDGATSSDAKLRSGKRPSLQPDGQVDVSTLNKKMKEYLDSIDTIPGALFKAGEQWMKFANDALSANNIVSDALGGLYSALESGLGTVFANLTNKTQTFKSAMKTIFSAIAQEVLAILSRIAAAAVFKLVLSFILGPEAAAAVMAGGAAGSKLTTGTPAPLLNVTINAIDKNGIYQSLTAPRGELRSAFGAAMTAGAY